MRGYAWPARYGPEVARVLEGLDRAITLDMELRGEDSPLQNGYIADAFFDPSRTGSVVVTVDGQIGADVTIFSLARRDKITAGAA
jgi:hypothetical protein